MFSFIFYFGVYKVGTRKGLESDWFFFLGGEGVELLKTTKINLYSSSIGSIQQREWQLNNTHNVNRIKLSNHCFFFFLGRAIIKSLKEKAKKNQIPIWSTTVLKTKKNGSPPASPVFNRTPFTCIALWYLFLLSIAFFYWTNRNPNFCFAGSNSSRTPII